MFNTWSIEEISCEPSNMLKGAGVQLVNFCLEPLTKHVECTSVCADNYSVANLISCHPTQQQLGFRVESFIRPPVHLFFYFLAPINIISVLVQPNLLEGMELRISVFGSTVTSLTQPEPHQMVLCGKGVMRTEGTVLALRNRTFERKHNIDLSSSDIVLGSHISPSDLLRQCEHSLKPVNNLRTLKLSITQFSGPKPVALKQVELWGTLGAATREEALAAHSVIANLRKPTNLVNEVSLFNSNPESCKVGHMCSGGASKSHKAAVMLPAHTGGREVCKSNNAQKTVYERKELPQYMTSLDFTTAEFPQNGKRVTGKGKANLQRPDNIASIQSTNPLCSSVPSSDYLRHGNLSMSHPSEISTGHQTNSSHCSLCVSPGKSCVRADGGRCEGSHGPSAVKGSSQGASCSSTVSATISSRILVNQSYNGDRASENGGTGLDSISDQIGSGDDDDYMEIPEQFFDEITCEMMLLPMLLPSGHFVDRSTLEKLQHTDSIYGRAPSDPFTGIFLVASGGSVENIVLCVWSYIWFLHVCFPEELYIISNNNY